MVQIQFCQACNSATYLTFPCGVCNGVFCGAHAGHVIHERHVKKAARPATFIAVDSIIELFGGSHARRA